MHFVCVVFLCIVVDYSCCWPYRPYITCNQFSVPNFPFAFCTQPPPSTPPPPRPPHHKPPAAQSSNHVATEQRRRSRAQRQQRECDRDQSEGGLQRRDHDHLHPGGRLAGPAVPRNSRHLSLPGRSGTCASTKNPTQSTIIIPPNQPHTIVYVWFL